MTSYTLDKPCADAVLEAMADGRERTLNDITLSMFDLQENDHADPQH